MIQNNLAAPSNNLEHKDETKTSILQSDEVKKASLKDKNACRHEQPKTDAQNKGINKREFKTVQYFLRGISKYFVSDNQDKCQTQENEQLKNNHANDQDEKSQSISCKDDHLLKLAADSVSDEKGRPRIQSDALAKDKFCINEDQEECDSEDELFDESFALKQGSTDSDSSFSSSDGTNS